MKAHYLALVAIGIAFSVALPSRGEIILPNLPAGSQYELVFVTR